MFLMRAFSRREDLSSSWAEQQARQFAKPKVNNKTVEQETLINIANPNSIDVARGNSAAGSYYHTLVAIKPASF